MELQVPTRTREDPSPVPDLKAPYRLVCARCRAILDEDHPSEARADMNADQHVLKEHDDRTTAVLTVPQELAEAEPREQLREALEVQQCAESKGRHAGDGGGTTA